MLLLKDAACRIRDRLFSDKALAQVQNSFVFQLVFLSTIKDYLGGIATPEKVFIVPDGAMKAAKTKKKVLVLDMDETLVHTRAQNPPKHRNYITVEYEGGPMYIEKRPLVDQFLDAVSQIFDVWVYTAGNKKYADLVLNTIDPQGRIQRRFYRDTCRKVNGTFIKDLKHLKKVSKTKAEMILVDDNRTSISHNYPFAVQVKQFEGPQQDRQLPTIFMNLLKFYGC